MTRVRVTLPPGFAVRLRYYTQGLERTILSWMPLSRDARRNRGQAIGHRYAAVCTKGTAAVTSRAMVGGDAPIMVGTLGALPPNEAI